MALTSVQFDSQAFEVSDDDGLTWATLVCLDSVTVTFASEITETATQCGTVVGVGEMKGNFDYTGVCNTTPDADEVSFKDVLTWQKAKQLVQIRCTNGSSGANWFYQFGAYFTNTTHDGTSNDVMKFSGTVTGQGEVDLSA